MRLSRSRFHRFEKRVQSRTEIGPDDGKAASASPMSASGIPARYSDCADRDAAQFHACEAPLIPRVARAACQALGLVSRPRYAVLMCARFAEGSRSQLNAHVCEAGLIS